MFGTLRSLVGVPSGLGEPAKVEARKLAAVPNRLGLCHVRPLQLRDALGLAALQAFALVRVFKARACLPEGRDRLVSDAARAASVGAAGRLLPVQFHDQLGARAARSHFWRDGVHACNAPAAWVSSQVYSCVRVKHIDKFVWERLPVRAAVVGSQHAGF